jgi:hypothetical protein
VTPRRWSAACVLLLAVLAPARSSQACASCGCGDPTLTALGTEKPFQNRLRLGGQLVVQGETSGTPRLDQITLREQRLDLQAAWAPSARLFLLASLPVVRREVTYVNLARSRARGVGDLELRAKLFLWEDHRFSPRHLLSAVAGARLPTTPWAHDARGVPWPSELQVGSGAWIPLAGLGYAHFHYPWSEYASVEASTPIAHQPAYRPPTAARATAAVQRQLGPRLAASLSLDARADGHVRDGGRRDPNTGGTIAFASPALLVTPATDLVIYVLARFPVVDRLAGAQTASPILTVGLAYDL